MRRASSSEPPSAKKSSSGPTSLISRTSSHRLRTICSHVYCVSSSFVAGRARPATNEEETQYTWEQMVRNLWLEVLEINDVGPDDDFFALGGSEEDARRMIDRLRAYSGSHVTYDEFAPTP